MDIPPSILTGLEYGTLAVIGYVAGSYLAEATARTKLKHHHAELPEESKAGIRFVFGGISAILTSAGYYVSPYASIGGFITGATILPYLFIHAPKGKGQKMPTTAQPQKSMPTIPAQHKEITLDDLAKEIETPVAPKKAANPPTQENKAEDKPKVSSTTATAKTPKRKTEHKSVSAIISSIFHRSETRASRTQRKEPDTKAKKPKENRAKQEHKEEKTVAEQTEKEKEEPARKEVKKKAEEGTQKQKKQPQKKKGLLAGILASLHGLRKQEPAPKHTVEKPKIVVEEIGTENKRVEPMGKKRLKISLPKHVKVEEIKAEHIAKVEPQAKKQAPKEENTKMKTTKTAEEPEPQKETKEQEDPDVVEFRNTLKEMERKYILHGTAPAKPQAKIPAQASNQVPAEPQPTPATLRKAETTKEAAAPMQEPKASETVVKQPTQSPARAASKLRPRDVDKAVKKILDELKKNVKDEILASDGKKIHRWREVRAAKEAAEKIAKTAEPIIRQRIMETGSTDIDPKVMAAQILAEIQGRTPPEISEGASSPRPERAVVRHEDIARIAEEVFEQVKGTIPVEEMAAPEKTERKHHRHHKEEEKKEEPTGKKEGKEKKEKHKKKRDEDLLGLLGDDESEDEDITSLLGEEEGSEGDLGLDLGEENSEEDEDLGELGELLK